MVAPADPIRCLRWVRASLPERGAGSGDGRSGLRIRAIALDMSQAYILVVETHSSEATFVFDHFHVVKLMNGKFSDLRRELQRQALEKDTDVLKGTRWLLRRAPEAGRDEGRARTPSGGARAQRTPGCCLLPEGGSHQLPDLPHDQAPAHAPASSRRSAAPITTTPYSPRPPRHRRRPPTPRNVYHTRPRF